MVVLRLSTAAAIFVFHSSCLSRTSNTFPTNQTHSDAADALAFDVQAVNQSRDLKAVLQTEVSRGACEVYFKAVGGPWAKLSFEEIYKRTSKNLREMCGKFLFTYGIPKAKGTVPERYLRGAMKAWPDLIGEAYTKAGLYPNPDDPGFPVGIPPSSEANFLGQALAGFKSRLPAACALCHFGKNPQGEYHYGMPNESFHMGRYALSLMYALWIFDQGRKEEGYWNPGLTQILESMKAQAEASKEPGVLLPDLSQIPKAIPITHMISLVASLSRLTKADQRDLLHDDVGKGPAFTLALATEEPLFLATPSLFGIEAPHDNTDVSAESVGSFAHSPSLEGHVAEALFIASASNIYESNIWTAPLSDFIRSLKPPRPKPSTSPDLVDSGRRLFEQRCKSCHAQQSGGGGKLFSATRLGILKNYESPYLLTNKPVGSVAKKNFAEILQLMGRIHAGTSRHVEELAGLKPRRLAGSWSKKYLMTTGAIYGLDHAFCLNGKLRKDKTPKDSDSDSVHSDLCTGSEEERIALKEFLMQW